ncbi:glycosyltransferase [Dietzia kunjamensis]|uniref:glycosyltransferase n=1 Tax=Dietzia kunjamensis TaxID=322509 RepID=UPI0020977DB4|nr:glycosyltransferase [Dietzia kunjamensis]USX45204.1 glycosyltransferase [Dietzia kunjamensis]
MARIAIFTSDYPYGTGEQFVDTEISIAAELGHDIVIWPLKAEGRRRELPPGVTVSLGLAELWNPRTFITAAAKTPLDRAVRKEALGLLSSKRLKSHGNILAIKSIQKKAIERSFIKLEPELRTFDVLYSYWAGLIPIGFAALGNHWNFASRVSRGHGSDIYQYAVHKQFAPFRAESWERLDRMYLISEHGLNYVQKISDIQDTRLALARLGTKVKHLEDAIDYQQEEVAILSIGNAVELKRLGVAVGACARLAEMLAPKPVTWVHIGSGPLEERILQACRSAKSRVDNFDFKMMGQIEHSEILEMLTRERFALLLSASSSEGIPVSQMEAMERGIPVVSTMVGGVTELIDGTDSIGVREDASKDEIAQAMEQLLRNGAPGNIGRDRIVEKYDLRENITNFYNELGLLR